MKSKRSPNIMRLVIVSLVILFGLYFGYKILGPKEQPAIIKEATVTTPKIEPEQAKLAQGIYERIYDTTFFYSNNKITVNNVRVTGLNKTGKKAKAKIVFSMSIIEPPVAARRNISWVIPSNFTVTRANGRYAAKRIKSRKVGQVNNASVVFTVSPKFLKSTSFLTINYYAKYSSFTTKQVSLGLTIPKLDVNNLTVPITNSTGATGSTGSVPQTGSTGTP